MALLVDQIIVQLLLVLTLRLIVVISNIFVHRKFLVEKMKDIVIPMMNVRLVLDVQAVHPILDSVQIYIVAQQEELVMEDGVFVLVVTHVALTKVTVTMMANARMV